MTRFATTVHAFDYEGVRRTFLPGDEAPKWALEKFGSHVFDVAPAAPIATEFDPDLAPTIPPTVDLDALDRASLVALAKEVGVKASGKSDAIIARLRELQPVAPIDTASLSRGELIAEATARGYDIDESTSDAELAFLISE